MTELRDEQRQVLVQRLGVFELRGLAREMGVPSPTTKKRDELIDLILQAFDKGVNQENKNQKRGRPYKKLNSLDELLCTVVDEEKEELSYESLLSFAQEEKPFVSFAGENVRFEGVSRVAENKVSIRPINGNEVIFVGDIYGKEKLENGDLVEVTAQKINNNDEYNALSLSLINGESAVMYQKKEFDLGKEIISDNKFYFGESPIYFGRRNACLLHNDLYETDNLKKLNDLCLRNGNVLVLLGANTSYENQILFKNLDIKYNFTTPYATNAKLNLNKTIDGLNFAENALKNGRNVIVVVSDLGGLLLALDENFDKENREHSKAAEIIAKKILAIAVTYDSAVSLTLLLCYSEVDKCDKFIQSDLLRVCKKC